MNKVFVVTFLLIIFSIFIGNANFGINKDFSLTKVEIIEINISSNFPIIDPDENITSPVIKNKESYHPRNFKKPHKPTNLNYKKFNPKYKSIKFKKKKKKCSIKDYFSFSERVIKTAKTFLGVKYRYGGNSRNGIDCSAFVKKVYSKHGKKLPRTSREQYRIGRKIKKSCAKKGDLIFFSDSSNRVGHVGIIIDPKKKKQ